MTVYFIIVAQKGKFMQSKLIHALRLKYQPVAIIWSDKGLDGALQFGEGKWGCVMTMFAQAAKGKTAIFSRRNYGCMGGGTGLGFGNQYLNYSGGVECFYRFLSSGNKDSDDAREAIQNATSTMRREAVDNFLFGERYVKTPELARKRIEAMPMIDIPSEYVIFKPLKDVNEKQERPEVVIFPVNPDQLSALVFLSNYARETGDNVIVPFGAGCHNIGIMAYAQAKEDNPKAIIGLTDLSARRYTASSLGHEYMTFAVPFKMYQELEDNVEGSFIERHAWKELMG
jgi:uncharacterized protein (DUF169 family)